MYFTYLLAPLLAATSTVAQHVHFEPPEVSRYVHSMNSEYSHYTHYPGPSPTWWHSHPHPPYPTHPIPPPPKERCEYWLANIKHQGVAAFNPNAATYKTFRNVKDYGAKGDGVTDVSHRGGQKGYAEHPGANGTCLKQSSVFIMYETHADAPARYFQDTAAINYAISSGGRCAPGSCNSTTLTPATVYFPPGIYMINSSIIDYYYTQLIGNPNCLPTIRAFSTFAAVNGSIGLIDGDPYGPNGLDYGSTNVFWRQIRNFIVDMTLIPGSSSATGVHWPTGQATSLQNVIFEMNSDNGTQQQGIYIESGSGGFMNDLVFNGGLYGLNVGNQQFTMRNLTFNNAVTAINQIWDWGWTYYGITINNCTTGLNMYSGGPTALSVGSITFFDSYISDTPVAIRTGYTSTSQPPTANSLILERISLNNVPVAVEGGANTTVLQGTPVNNFISAWGEGHSYTPNGPNDFQGFIQPVSRPSSLVQADGNYYQRSKPQYQQYRVRDFISVRSVGATGNGVTDDTKAFQKAINLALAQSKIVFVDGGDYLVTDTIYIPAGSRIQGEAYPVILSSGEYFNDMSKPKPVVQIGKPGESGSIEWSDMIVSTQGQQRGAILFEHNLKAPAGNPTGVWDVHARIGGFTGSNLSLAECPTTPTVKVTAANLDYHCIGAFLTVHITSSAEGLYLENNWIWTADHDVDDPLQRQITVYSGRGLLDESSGPVWLVGTAVEHHVKYEYQFAHAQDVFAGQIQTETAYYQPNPSAPLPFPYVASLYDPKFPDKTVQVGNYTIPAADGWGLRIVDSDSISIYGAGLYSFFDNYSTNCSAQGNGEVCQDRIFSLEGDSSSITVYNENTVGTHYMIAIDGKNVAYYDDNLDGFVDTIALFRSS